MSEFNIGGFEVIERIGTGGMATVWRARQVTLDRIVAIKILSSQLAADPGDVQRFQMEAQAAAKLKHPGIVQVYDANVQDGIYYFVMEYVAGYTVGDWLRRKGVLPEADALLVAECVSDALQYAWDTAGIIHCDIKPDNVIVDADGTVKVADLGLARTISAMNAEGTPEEIMGTPAYVSPEQAMGDASLDFRADVYSLGASLYHLVTGQALFAGHSEADIMDLQITRTVPDAVDVNRDVSKPLGWMLEKMLAKDKAHRYRDWGEVRSDIDRVKRGFSPLHHLPESGYSTMQRSRTRTRSGYARRLDPAKKKSSAPYGIAVGAVALCAIALGLGLWLSRRHGSEPEGKPHPPATGMTGAVKKPPGKRDKAHGKARKTHEKEARERLAAARQWAAENPERIDDAIHRYEGIVESASGTPVAGEAQREIDKIRELRKTREGTERVLDRLREETAELIARESYTEAARVLEQYTGEYAAQTKVRRMLMARALRKRYKGATTVRLNRATIVANKVRFLQEDVSRALVTSGVAVATEVLQKADRDVDLRGSRDVLRGIADVLVDIRREERSALGSFEESVGKKLTVDMATGWRTLTIKSVAADQVDALEDLGGALGEREIQFGLQDLSAREKLMRLGAEETPAVDLVKGLMALRSKAYRHARGYLRKTECALTESLLLCVDDMEDGVDDEAARAALRELVAKLGLQVGPYDEQKWLAAIRQKDTAGAETDSAVQSYRRKYGRTQFARGAETILFALTQGH